MKTKTLYRLAGILIIPLAYYAVFTGFKAGENVSANSIEIPSYTSSPPPGWKFINGILNNDRSWTPPERWLSHQMENYRGELNFNMVHTYDNINGNGQTTNNGTWLYGEFEPSLTSGQMTRITGLSDSVDNEDLMFFFERCKISKLCYGQRLVYEVSNGGSTTVNDGFCYQTCEGEYLENDMGNTALHLDPIEDAGLANTCIAKNIYENLQHGDLGFWNIQYADKGFWYIKPRMRIDSTIVDNYPEQEVVAIEIYGYNSSTPIKTITIKAKHFAQNVAGTIYGGEYTDNFNAIQDPNFDLSIEGGNGSPHYPPQLNDGQLENIRWEWPENCETDFRVYWYGTVEVWFDKMTVDDEIANILFETERKDNYDSKIIDELNYYKSTSPIRKYTFFADECLYSNIPCIKFVQDKIDYFSDSLGLSPAPKLITAGTQFLNSVGLKHDATAFKGFLKTVQPELFQIDAHEISGWRNSNDEWVYGDYLPDSIESIIDTRIDDDWIVSYSTYNNYLQNWVFGSKNMNLTEHEAGGLVYQVNLAKEQIEDYSSNTQLIVQPQIQGILNEINGKFKYGSREPLNQELEAELMVSIAHGAQGIDWYIYQTTGWNETVDTYTRRPLSYYYTELGSPQNGYIHTFGMLTENNGSLPRTANLYGQNKWTYVAGLNAKLEKWYPVLETSEWQSGWSVHVEGANHEFISDIMSINPYKTGQNPCVNDYQTGSFPYGPYLDCPEERYWEMGFFTPAVSNTRYFVMVNRRCMPAVPGANPPVLGDNRVLRIKFNLNQMPSSLVNWRLTEVGGQTGEEITFSTNNSGFIDLGGDESDMGWFDPGEGKLFKLEPILKSGGTLIADEDIPSGENFTCEDTVWTNGYDLTIEDGVSISFSDSAKFVVRGGTFQMGNAQHSGPNTINMDAASGNTWKGFEFDTCEVKIYGVNFSGLANDSISMLTMLDCPVIDIRGCSFDTETGSEKGVIDVEYSGSYGTSINDNVYIKSNTFETGNAEIPAVKVMAYSGITNPVIIEDNNFTGNNTAVFLSNIQGGAVKSNTFTDYGRSLTALSSSVDVFGNTVSSGGLYGLEGLSGTELKMSYAGGMLVGGRNTITNPDTGSYNIYLEDSYFLMDEGENVFDIGPDSYHLYGWFPESYESNFDETENCFKVQGNPVDPPNHYVTLGEQGYQITDFVFEPYLDGCLGGGDGERMAINLGNGIFDTVLVMGSGGSMKGEYVISPKALYDSISISMRFRNYNNVKTLCTQLLNAYPDSPSSIGAVSKLYIATAKTDTSSQGITDLKSLYEGLILNHPNNITLVKRCNYFVQKCKVLLHQYSSALSGFQLIINQNQYNYLGLVARWDYMATSLLMQGQGGAVSSEKPYSWGVIEGDDGDDNDKTPFTKQEKKQIKQTVSTALELSKTKEKKQIEVLTELSKRGDEKATKQLKTKKALEQTVKTEKPKSIIEHMRIVTNDIKRVFVNPNSGKNKSNAFIPTVYNLSQNYPNPFNPKTKINYDIPENSYVKLIVYDILGREVVRLVNNELKQPGRYTVEFNGTNFASGVYFFRLEAGNYVKAKKMVLVK